MIRLLQRHKFNTSIPVHVVRLTQHIQTFPQFNITLESASTVLKSPNPKDNYDEIIERIQTDLDTISNLPQRAKGYIFAFGYIIPKMHNVRLMNYAKMVML